MTLRQRLGIALALAVTLTCKDSTGPGVSVTVAGPQTLFLGDTSRFTATAVAGDGANLSAEPRTWRSTNPMVATVDAAGLVRTLALGTANIEATVRGRAASQRLNVVPNPVVAVAVTPAADSVLLGDSLQLTAVALNNNGLPVPGRVVSWSSPDTARGTVSATGMVRPRRAEGFVIHARIDGKLGGAFVRGQEALAAIVLPDTAEVERGRTVGFAPDLYGPSGAPVTGRVLNWTIENPTVATVPSPAQDGFVTTIKAGTTKLIASCCGFADTTILVIQPRPVRTIDILPPLVPTVIVGRPATVRAEVRNQDLLLEEVPVAWHSTDTTVLAVTPNPADTRNAELFGRRPGMVRLIASSGDYADTTQVFVELPIVAVTIEPDTLSLISASQRQAHAVFRDSAGGFHGDAPSSWWTTDTLVAKTLAGQATIPAILGRSPGTTLLIARATNGATILEDTTVVVVHPTATPRFYWNVEAQFVDAFLPFSMTLTLSDSAGGALPSGKAVNFTADTSIAFSPATIPDLNGATTIQVTGRRDGRFTVTAHTDLLSTTFLLQVVRHRVDSLRVSAPALLTVGDSVAVSAMVFGGGTGVATYPRTLSVSDPSLASLNAAGVLRGLAPGRVELTGRSFEASHTVTITIRSTGGPAIDTAAATPIVAGATVTIPGSGFATTPGDNVVLIDGVPATVTAATPTLLTILAPPTSRFPCGPARAVTVSVATAAGLDARLFDLVTATSVAVPLGGTVYLPDGRAGCLEIASAAGFAEYNLAIVNTVPSAEAATPLTITGRTPGTAAAFGQDVTTPAAPRGDVSQVPGLRRSRAAAQLHRRVLAENRRFAALAGPPAPLLRAMPRFLSSVNDSINEVVQIRVPQIYRPDFCVNHSTIRARRVYTGTKIVIYEDVASVLAGLMDAEFQILGIQVERDMLPILAANFGNPLVMDSLLDRNGRIAMVFSPEVNATGAAGFVVTCDFYPESVAPSSNVGEMFYAFAPVNRSSGFEAGSLSEWRWLIRSVIMHELKHVTAVAERLAHGGSVEESWLEEGSAVLAEELWSRSFYGNNWKSNALYNQTIFCDVRPACGGPYSMFNAFAFLYDYANGFTSPPGNEARTPLGPADYSDGSFYGSAWLWLRWIVDHYASSESAFLTALTQDVSRSGVGHFDALVPEGWPRLMTEWALANHLDDGSVTTGPNQQHLSWHLPDIFRGMYLDFPSFFTQLYPFRMRQSAFGGFGHSLPTLRGGTAAVMRIVGVQTVPQLVEIRDPRGGTPPIQVQVMRVR